MSHKQTLCKAKRLCWILNNMIHQSAYEKAIEYMDEQKPWLSENEDSLPRCFLESWTHIHKTLSNSEEKMELVNLPDRHMNARLTKEVHEHRDSCPDLLRMSASVLRQAIESLN